MGSALEAVARACQVVAGQAIAWSAPADPEVLSQYFSRVPQPLGSIEQLAIEGLLQRFTAELANRIDDHFHRRFGGVCQFTCHACKSPMSSMNVRGAVLLWATAYTDAFLRAHSDTTAAVLAFLDNNVHLSANALAGRAGCSLRTLERRVLQATGFSIAACRTRARVRRAVELLEIGLKVDSAAEAVGWRSKKDLYHGFRTCVPFLPADVRKMTKEEVQLVVRRLSGPRYGR